MSTLYTKKNNRKISEACTHVDIRETPSPKDKKQTGKCKHTNEKAVPISQTPSKQHKNALPTKILFSGDSPVNPNSQTWFGDGYHLWHKDETGSFRYLPFT